MQSGGFRIGKQAKAEPSSNGQEIAPSKATEPPSHQTLVQLLLSSQKAPDHPFSVSWPSSTGDCQYILTVTSFSSQRERRGWAIVAAEESQIGEPAWTLFKESEGKRTELWSMRSVDAALILTLLKPELFEVQAPQAQTFSPAGQQTGTSSQFAGQTTAADNPFVKPSPASQQFQTFSGIPALQDNSSAASLLLSGNLNEVELPNVLQSIGLCKMTGKLSVYNNPIQVEVYFNNGALVHAVASHAFFDREGRTGHEVILDIFTWDEGGFQFQPGWKAPAETISRRLESLLMEGAALRDYKDFLDRLPLEPVSVLALAPDVAMNPVLELEARYRQGLPINLEQQKAVLEHLHQSKTLESLLEALPMASSTWIPVLFNLITLKLVTVDSSGLRVESDFANVDDLIAATYRTLLTPVGLLNYGLCLMLARSEFSRFEHGHAPFAIAIVDLETGVRDLSTEAVRKISECFDEVSQDIDSLAQCNASRLIALLPHNQPEEAFSTVRRFLQLLSTTRLDSLTEGSSLNAVAGVACVPRDGVELQHVLNQACRFRRLATPENPIVSGTG